jgi:hypothetical protein
MLIALASPVARKPKLEGRYLATQVQSKKIWTRWLKFRAPKAYPAFKPAPRSDQDPADTGDVHNPSTLAKLESQTSSATLKHQRTCLPHALPPINQSAFNAKPVVTFTVLFASKEPRIFPLTTERIVQRILSWLRPWNLSLGLPLSTLIEAMRNLLSSAKVALINELMR